MRKRTIANTWDDKKSIFVSLITLYTPSKSHYILPLLLVSWLGWYRYQFHHWTSCPHFFFFEITWPCCGLLVDPKRLCLCWYHDACLPPFQNFPISVCLLQTTVALSGLTLPLGICKTTWHGENHQYITGVYPNINYINNTWLGYIHQLYQHHIYRGYTLW